MYFYTNFHTNSLLLLLRLHSLMSFHFVASNPMFHAILCALSSLPNLLPNPLPNESQTNHNRISPKKQISTERIFPQSPPLIAHKIRSLAQTTQMSPSRTTRQLTKSLHPVKKSQSTRSARPTMNQRPTVASRRT